MKSSDNNLINNSSADFVPIVCHYNEDTLITKNGELLKTIQVNGINSDKISEELFNLRQVVRQAICSSVASHKYAFWVHTIRRKANLDDSTPYIHFFSANIHEIWKNKNFWHDKFVNALYITIIHDAPRMKIKNFSSLVNSISPKIVSQFEEKYFVKAEAELSELTDNILSILSNYGADKLGIRFEGDKSYSDLMFLYRRIMQLDEHDCELPYSDLSLALASHNYTVGSDKLEVVNDSERKFAAILSIKEYQDVSADAIDKFLQIPVEMVATEIFYFVDKKDVTKLFKEQDYILKISKDAELRKLKGLDIIFEREDDSIRFCQQQISVMIIGDDVQNLDQQVSMASHALAEIGIVHVREDINLEKTFWAQLPSNFAFLSRMKPTVIENTAALASLHNFPTGNQHGPWGKSLTLLRTERGTPFFMNFHDKEGKAKTCIFGFKKTGKTTLMNFLLSESDKYNPTTVYITDDSDSCIYIKAREGSWFQRSKNLFNPFMCEDNQDNKVFIYNFLKIILNHHFDPLREDEIALIKEFCNYIFAIPVKERNFTEIMQHLNETIGVENSLARRCQVFLEGGDYYQLFDSDEQLILEDGELIAFNLEAFNDELYIKTNYPKEQKLVENFKYNLSIMRAVKAGIALALSNVLENSANEKKILAIDNCSEIIDLNYYQPVIDYIQNRLDNINAVSIINISLEKMLAMQKAHNVHQWVTTLNTTIILPADNNLDGVETLRNLDRIIFNKLSKLDISSRRFLIQQDGHNIFSELAIGGLVAAVRIFCATEHEIKLFSEIMNDNKGGDAAQWVEILYNKLEEKHS